MMPTFPRPPPIIPYGGFSPVRLEGRLFRWRLPDFHARLSLLPTYMPCQPVCFHPSYTSWSNGYPALSQDADSIVHRHEVEITTPTPGVTAPPRPRIRTESSQLTLYQPRCSVCVKRPLCAKSCRSSDLAAAKRNSRGLRRPLRPGVPNRRRLQASVGNSGKA